MLLPQQLQAILYHFLMGWVYAMLFSSLLMLTRGIRFRLLKAAMEILFHLLFTSALFFGLFQINGGVTNVYLIAFFLCGVYLYYRFYLPVFMELMMAWKRFIAPLYRKLRLAKLKIVAIIKIPVKRRRRRKDAKREKRGRSKKKKEKASVPRRF